jgi:hypothetical protein
MTFCPWKRSKAEFIHARFALPVIDQQDRNG